MIANVQLRSVLDLVPGARRLFVGGVSASGKTTACRLTARRSTKDIRHEHLGALACALAAEYALADASMESATEAALDRLQTLIGNALAEKLERSGVPRVLIDGHFVIDLESNRPYRIPLSLFRALRVDGLIICVAPPNVIRERRLADPEPRRLVNDVRTIAMSQLSEILHARDIARSLRIPLFALWTHGARRLRVQDQSGPITRRRPVDR